MRQASAMARAGTLSLPAGGSGSGIALAVASMSTIQLGAALSEPLFDRVGPAGVVALRLGIAALVLWPFARPRIRGRSPEDLAAAAALGVCSGLLTLAFFEAIARIPLGVAVTIELLGPLGVALAGSRRRGAPRRRRRGVLGRLHPADQAGRRGVARPRGALGLAGRGGAGHAPVRP